MSQDPNAIYSELILWRVDPVGPLSFSGGVSELARINSLHASAFSNVAWLPTLIPSNCLGVYGNSPSACFAASDGHSLRLYQAVIEAKKLLSELSNPEISKYVGEVFNIISQQSTARPGCIIELDAITELQGKETQLLHVFEEDLILGSETDPTQDVPPTETDHGDFSARFFLVVLEYTQTGRSLLHMWHLQLAALQVTVDETPTDPSASQNGPQFAPPSEAGAPEGVEVTRVTPSAGHLSSSSLQPAGRAPYLLATSCSDGKVRFWRCRTATESVAPGDVAYAWEEWPLLVEEGRPNSSAVSVPGRPEELSCCHTSRMAVVYRQERPLQAGRGTSTHVAVFQCESTGGSQWTLEQTLGLDDISPAPAAEWAEPGSRAPVHLDWVSREDGSHILTVGVGSKLQMFGPLSGKPAELGLSEGACSARPAWSCCAPSTWCRQ
ncbi:hypothetical protein ANANG_G00199430 [Anguilla anguilla]|uniref:Uncharacterized protein n=1 Tax=Anguilla anguilla TaxID=7936 RepID=A0A9D3M2M4_ANGAN|nr:hypothetical protein ANANG_G00199430 [Anguilla anguilla]